MSEPILERISKVLSKIKKPGNFSCGGQLPFVNPGLIVNGFGLVPLPLTAFNAVELIKQCKRSPYGLGEQTLVDPAVRNSWQLDPSEVKLANLRPWNIMVTDLLETVRTALGIDKNIVGEFYKVLIYETGGHFAKHRDTEKSPGMFGTLIIELPSSYEGGELIIHMQNKTVAYTHAPEPLTYHFDLHYTGFFADCEHEILPLKSGYRICLVYNMKYKDTNAQLPKLVLHDQNEKKLVELFEEWNEEKDPDCGIYMLEHKYTQSSLSVTTLKNRDYAVASVLRNIALEHTKLFRAYVAIIELEQTGQGEYVGRPRYHSDNDWAMGDVDSSDLTMTIEDPLDPSFPDFDGIDDISLDDIMQGEDYFGSRTNPDKVEKEGYTGNEGITITHWYKRAGIVIIPQFARAKFNIQSWSDEEEEQDGKEENDAESGKKRPAPEAHGEPAAKKSNRDAPIVID